MGKQKPVFTIQSYGLYTEWDRQSRNLPKIIKHTLEIPASIGVEFGFILSVKKAKGEILTYRIQHPPFMDPEGNPAPDFTGTYFINSNDFLFFLGDTIWEPIEDKTGEWILSVEWGGKEIAKKIFRLI